MHDGGSVETMANHRRPDKIAGAVIPVVACSFTLSPRNRIDLNPIKGNTQRQGKPRLVWGIFLCLSPYPKAQLLRDKAFFADPKAIATPVPV
jgi:hypothetical protein